MSNERNDGGPAFPTADSIGTDGEKEIHFVGENPGMSLRDWFAGQALAGITAGHWANEAADAVPNSAIAADSYALADAMLQQREKAS